MEYLVPFINVPFMMIIVHVALTFPYIVRTLQAKLLGVIETRTVTRLGSNKATPVDVRLICATNLPIHEMVSNNEFRQDLLYRINTVEIQIPALRKRSEDISLLVDHFLKIYSKKYQNNFC